MNPEILNVLTNPSLQIAGGAAVFNGVFGLWLRRLDIDPARTVDRLITGAALTWLAQHLDVARAMVEAPPPILGAEAGILALTIARFASDRTTGLAPWDIADKGFGGFLGLFAGLMVSLGNQQVTNEGKAICYGTAITVGTGIGVLAYLKGYSIPELWWKIPKWGGIEAPTPSVAAQGRAVEALDALAAFRQPDAKKAAWICDKKCRRLVDWLRNNKNMSFAHIPWWKIGYRGDCVMGKNLEDVKKVVGGYDKLKNGLRNDDPILQRKAHEEIGTGLGMSPGVIADFNDSVY